jgi:hypothetical protein
MLTCEKSIARLVIPTTRSSSRLQMLRALRHKLLDRDLLKAAFWFTSFGCTYANERQLLLPDGYRLVLEYECRRVLRLRGPLDAFSHHRRSSQDWEEPGYEEEDCVFQEEPLPEELPDIKRIDSAKARDAIDFLRPYLVRAVLEDLPVEEHDPEIPEQIDLLLAS